MPPVQLLGGFYFMIRLTLPANVICSLTPNVKYMQIDIFGIMQSQCLEHDPINRDLED